MTTSTIILQNNYTFSLPKQWQPLLFSTTIFVFSKMSFESKSVSRSAAAAARSCQSCPTLCNPIDGSPPGSPVPGILQARTLEWVAISFSKAWKWKVKVKSLSCVQLFATKWTAAYQAPPSMGFPRQEYWSGVPLPSPVSRSMVSSFLQSQVPLSVKFSRQEYLSG